MDAFVERLRRFIDQHAARERADREARAFLATHPNVDRRVGTRMVKILRAAERSGNAMTLDDALWEVLRAARAKARKPKRPTK